MLSGQNPPPYDAATILELTLRRYRVLSFYRLRKRYGELLREEIAQTVNRPEEIEDELRYLVRVLSS